jgi:hypothetical protein
MSRNQRNPSTAGAATLDTCAIIRMFEVGLPGQSAMCRLKSAWADGQIRLLVSRRTLYELRRQPPDDALTFAERIEVLPYYPVGSWKDVNDVSWNQLHGTWEDARRLHAVQETLPVRKGVKIKDRGIIIDSIQAGIQIVVTTDKGMIDRHDEVRRITGVRPLSPDEAAAVLAARRYCPN